MNAHQRRTNRRAIRRRLSFVMWRASATAQICAGLIGESAAIRAASAKTETDRAMKGFALHKLHSLTEHDIKARIDHAVIGLQLAAQAKDSAP